MGHPSEPILAKPYAAPQARLAAMNLQSLHTSAKPNVAYFSVVTDADAA